MEIKHSIHVTFLILIGVILISSCTIVPSMSDNYGVISKFESEDQLKTFLKEKQRDGYYSNYGIMEEVSAQIKTTTADGSGTRIPDARDYSTTNIQVRGVDEPDIVKNDGKYIYVVSDSNRKISIIEAYPAENAKILSDIDVNGTIDEIFLNKETLIVFGRENMIYEDPVPLGGVTKVASSLIYPTPYYTSKSFVRIYDITNKNSPMIEQNIVIDGEYFDSRMINNYVYVILNQPIGFRDDVVIMPAVKANEETVPIKAEEVYYFDIPDYSYRLTTILAINVKSGDFEKKSFLTGYTQNIFVSQSNIYLTSQKQYSYIEYQKRITEEVILKLVDLETANKIREVLNEDITYYERDERISQFFEDYFNKLSEDEKEDIIKRQREITREIEVEIQKDLEKTIVHKIEINSDIIDYKKRGEVPGHLLNQFSMDEYKGDLRIATTTGDVWTGRSANHMYVLNENLDIIGKLENLALSERIYSVRFIGERAYMVTFKKIDPLFVIDLSNSENPRVLGELKIPGYSDYLHPYDENHIIGVGKEAVDASLTEAEQRNLDFAWYQGIKISLFDVSDLSNPKEISKYNIGERGTDSEALYEHKAFLFDKEKELLVVPITLAEVDRSKYPSGIPPEAYGETKFIGAYVLSLNLEDGFKLKGRITHVDKEIPQGQYYYDYRSNIRRSLYIENILYTISQKMIKANDLDNLNEVSEIEFPYHEFGPEPLPIEVINPAGLVTSSRIA